MFTVIAAFATITSNMARAEGVPPFDPQSAPDEADSAGQPSAGHGQRPLRIRSRMMARPPKSDDEKLAKVLAFRLTEDDFRAYRDKFRASHMNQSEFFREHVLNNTTQVIARPVASANSRRAVFLLQKASNNINQLAHRANSENLAGKLSEGTFIQVLAQLERLNDFLIEQTVGANP